MTYSSKKYDILSFNTNKHTAMYVVLFKLFRFPDWIRIAMTFSVVATRDFCFFVFDMVQPYPMYTVVRLVNFCSGFFYVEDPAVRLHETYLSYTCVL